MEKRTTLRRRFIVNNIEANRTVLIDFLSILCKFQAIQNLTTIMNQYQDIYAAPNVVATQPVETRAEFIRKTYYHLAGAIGAFSVILFATTYIAITTGLGPTILKLTGGFGWLVVLGLFMGASYIANKWARSDTSKGTQYAGLILYTVAEALIFTPLMLILFYFTGIEATVSLLTKAGVITAGLFAGLSFIAITTKKDFSFLGGIVKIGFFVALGLIAVSYISGGAISLGIWFSAAMCLLAGGSILYNTSNMIHHYRTDQYVAASIGLFASFALLLWYVIQILLSLSSSD